MNVKIIFNVQVIYKGTNRQTKVYLWLNGTHFDVIKNPAAFYGSQNYCSECEKPFKRVEDHRCAVLCHICRKVDCEAGDTIRCAECDRNCRSENCYNAHKARGICDKVSVIYILNYMKRVMKLRCTTWFFLTDLPMSKML